jgi:uncharacterized protein
MDTNTNAINWFEIPVTDMERAKHFYQVIFSIHMTDGDMKDMQMAFFPYEPGSGKAAGALVKSNFHEPSLAGTIIYLNGNPDLSAVLDKVESEGGSILMPKTKISDDIGYMAFIQDTEGNRIAVHSQH